MSFSDYTENKILDHITGKTAFPLPTVYVGLSTADPLDSGSGLAEPSGGGYARVLASGASWYSAVGGTVANAAEIIFPQATFAWGVVTHFALFDAASGGNMLAHAILAASKVIVAGSIVKFAVGDLDITLD